MDLPTSARRVTGAGKTAAGRRGDHSLPASGRAPKGWHSHACHISSGERRADKTIADFTANDFMSARCRSFTVRFDGGLFTPLLTGAEVFIQVRRTIALCRKSGLHRNCTVLFGTSTFPATTRALPIRMILRARAMWVAGAENFRRAPKQLWQIPGLRILEGYGVTECAPVVSINADGG